MTFIDNAHHRLTIKPRIVTAKFHSQRDIATTAAESAYVSTTWTVPPSREMYHPANVSLHRVLLRSSVRPPLTRSTVARLASRRIVERAETMREIRIETPTQHVR
jgi:hypothetical protein